MHSTTTLTAVVALNYYHSLYPETLHLNSPSTADTLQLPLVSSLFVNESVLY